MGRFIRFACFTILATSASLAGASENTPNSPAALLWRCWYDQQVHITCIVARIPESGNPSSASIPSDLPPLVATMRANPGALRNRVIHIPLHTEPFDMEFTAVLAKASVCGTRRGCAVNFSEKLPPAEEVIALLNKHAPMAPGNTRMALALLDEVLSDIQQGFGSGYR